MNTAGIASGGRLPDGPPGPKFPQAVDVEVDCGVWDLRANPERLTQAAASWREHGDQTSAAAEDVHRVCRELLDAERLEGEVAARFDGYETELIAKLDQYEGVAERVAEQLDEAAASLRGHQRTLDGMREAILARVPGRETRLDDESPPPTKPPGRYGPDTGLNPDAASSPTTGCVAPPPTHIVFQASSFDDLRAIEDAKAEAKQVRAEVDKKNEEVHDKLDEIARDLGMMGRELVPDHGCGTAEVNNRDRSGRRLPGAQSLVRLAPDGRGEAREPSGTAPSGHSRPSHSPSPFAARSAVWRSRSVRSRIVIALYSRRYAKVSRVGPSACSASGSGSSTRRLPLSRNRTVNRRLYFDRDRMALRSSSRASTCSSSSIAARATTAIGTLRLRQARGLSSHSCRSRW